MELRCGRKDSLKAGENVLASQVAECDVRNLNSKEYSKQSICPFVSELRAEVGAEALTSRDGGVREPPRLPSLLLLDAISAVLCS